MPPSARRLSAFAARKAAFVEQFLVDFDVAAAAARIGLQRRAGYHLSRQPDVAAAIAARQAERLRAADLSMARTLEELRRVSFSNIRDFLDADGNLLPLHRIPRDVTAALASVEIVMKNARADDGVIDRVLKIRLWPKVQALETLAKHFGILVEHVEMHADAELADLLRAGRQRLDAARGELQHALDAAPALEPTSTVTAAVARPEPTPEQIARSRKRSAAAKARQARARAARAVSQNVPRGTTPATDYALDDVPQQHTPSASSVPKRNMAELPASSLSVPEQHAEPSRSSTSGPRPPRRRRDPQPLDSFD